MKLLKHRLFQRMLSNKGYTIDQTILIVAIIAILITLVIITVGWQLINRTGGTKVAAQIKQIEDANGQFFSQHRMWPHDATTASTAAQAILALANQATFKTTANGGPIAADRKNNIPGFAVASSVVRHNFGSGGAITMYPNKYNTTAGIGTDTRYVVQFQSVPFAEAKEADINIDGKEGAGVGRIIYGTGTCLNATLGGTATIPTAATSGLVTLCYAANTI